MKVTATGYPGTMVPVVPASCSLCGVELRGCALDDPRGWLCSMECGTPGAASRTSPPRVVRFSDTGLRRPS